MMSSDSHKYHLCGKVFKTQNGIDKHLHKPLGCAGRRAGNGAGTNGSTISTSLHKCYLCRKTFVTQRGIDRHMRKSH